MSSGEKVIVVGAGLAGLNCALQLKKSGIPVLLIEAADGVGGRIRTDVVDGYRLDRGFQVLLTAYPDARRVLNYDQLQLRPFAPGALVRYDGQFHRVADPMRDPGHIVSTLVSPIGTIADKMLVAKLRLSAMQIRDARGSDSREYNGVDSASESRSTLDLLRQTGFSDAIIERFFRPFFGGVFLQNDLSTASRNFEFLFKMFASGDTAIPAMGMEEIPKQLAQQVGYENIMLNSRVLAVANDSVVLSTGQKFHAPHIVMATEEHVLSEVLYDLPSEPHDNSVSCLYFSTAGKPPVDDPILVLNGGGYGIINNMCVPSLVSPGYAPEGKSLISVTVLGTPTEADLLRRVKHELTDWFGAQTAAWEHIRTYRINHALPKQTTSKSANYQLRDGLYVCGDHMNIGSINGALESGRCVAKIISTHYDNVASTH